mgnify:CR=1 FL=1
MFQFIYNLLSTIFYSVWSIVLCFITDKMPKVSAYHFVDSKFDASAIFICSDDYIKIDKHSFVDEECKKVIIRAWLNSSDTRDVINSELVRTKLINSL